MLSSLVFFLDYGVYVPPVWSQLSCSSCLWCKQEFKTSFNQQWFLLGCMSWDNSLGLFMESLVFSSLIKHWVESLWKSKHFDAVCFSSDFIQILPHISLICVGVCLVCAVCSFLPFPFIKSVYMIETMFYFGGSFFYAFLIILWKLKVQDAYLVVDDAGDSLSFHGALPPDFRLSG